MHDIQERFSRTVVEVGRTSGETAQDWSFYFAYMVEFAVYEALAEIACSPAIIRRLIRVRIGFADCDLRQVTYAESSEIDGRVGWIWISGADVQGSRKRVVADIRCVVTGAAGSLK